MEPMPRRTNVGANTRGFSRIDLTVAVAVLAIGFALLLPALGRQRNYSGTMVGGSNLKRLTAAWHLYAMDNGEKLVPTRDGASSGAITSKLSWVAGWLNFDNQRQDNTNTSYLTYPYGLRGPLSGGAIPFRQSGGVLRHYGGLLGSYEADPFLFRSPNDPSHIVTIGSRPLPRPRSISMNLMLGANGVLDGFVNQNVNYGYRTLPRLSSLTRPSPSSTFVLIEEHPESINDGNFVVDMGNPGAMVDWTANFSNRGFWISFADGRVDLWRSKGANFQRPYLGGVVVSTANLSPSEQTFYQRIRAATTSQ